MRIALVALLVAAAAVVVVACGGPKPPMVPDNPDLNAAPDGSAPSSPPVNPG